jgi:hypothetical protein
VLGLISSFTLFSILIIVMFVVSALAHRISIEISSSCNLMQRSVLKLVQYLVIKYCLRKFM